MDKYVLLGKYLSGTEIDFIAASGPMEGADYDVDLNFNQLPGHQYGRKCIDSLVVMNLSPQS